MPQELATKQRQKIERDPKIPGLHIIHGSKRSTWYLYYRTKARVERRQKLGCVGTINVTRAREMARKILAAIDEGRDPTLEKVDHSQGHTIQQLWDQYDQMHSSVELKARSRHNQIYQWKHIIKFFGAARQLTQIKRSDVIDFKSSLRDSPYQANRCLALLSHAFHLAEDWGWIPERSSPVYRVKHYKETRRKRVPTIEEMQNLFAAIGRMRETDPWFAGMIALMCFLGARRSEIMTSKHEYWQPHGIVLPDSKTGAKIIPMNASAWAVYASIPRVEANPYVIVGRCAGDHLREPKFAWQRLLKDAGIENLRMHDLRRWFASVSISSGQTLEQTMQLMGHSSPLTTRGYAFLMDHAKNAAMENTAQRMLEMVEKKPSAKAG